VNYLPAVDAEIEAEEDVANQSLDMTRVLELLDEAKTRINLVFLDACRNNPFSRRFRSASRGLAKVDAASGTLISFATRPGSVAADGDGKNGLYTEHLLNHMSTAGLPVEQMLKRVGSEVKLASKGRQEPWSEGLLEGDFYFRPAAAPAAVAASATSVDPAVLELALWDSVKNSRSAEELSAYLDQYPKGRFAAVARARLKSLGAAPVAASAAQPSAPAQQLALAAPASSVPRTSSAGGLPQVGDSWTYRLTQLDRKDEFRQQRYTVNVTAVSEAGISERFSMESGESGLARHGAGSYLAPLGPALFSPYLPLFQELAAGSSVGQVVVRDGTCSPDYACDAVARVAGREKKPLGDLFGLSNFGVNLTRLAPGAQSALRHAHAKQDEFVYILEGRATLITDAGETELAPGMCAGFKAGTGDAHHLVNRSRQDVLYLEIGDRTPGESATYPDDDLQVVQDAAGKWRYLHKDGTPY